MNEPRKQFEGLPEIERHVKNGFIEFVGNHYFLPEHVNNDGSQAFLIHKHNVTWVNGAWWAFQQQKKNTQIVLSKIHKFEEQTSSDKSIFMNDLLKEIKELLK